jgi:hypothetical protein
MVLVVTTIGKAKSLLLSSWEMSRYPLRSKTRFPDCLQQQQRRQRRQWRQWTEGRKKGRISQPKPYPSSSTLEICPKARRDAVQLQIRSRLRSNWQRQRRRHVVLCVSVLPSFLLPAFLPFWHFINNSYTAHTHTARSHNPRSIGPRPPTTLWRRVGKLTVDQSGGGQSSTLSVRACSTTNSESAARRRPSSRGGEAGGEGGSRQQPIYCQLE